MKIFVGLVVVCLAISVECGRGRHEGRHGGRDELHEMCQDDESCHENGRLCFEAFKIVALTEMNWNRTSRMEERDTCLNDTGLMDQYKNFKPRRGLEDEEDPEDLLDPTENEVDPMEEDVEATTVQYEDGEADGYNRHRHGGGRGHRHHHRGHGHHHRGHHGHRGHCEKRKFKAFMRMLEETAPESATALRCCMANNISVVNDGVVDKDALKNKFTTVLTHPSIAKQRDALIGAVDSCGDLVDCKGKDYVKCLLATCAKNN